MGRLIDQDDVLMCLTGDITGMDIKDYIKMVATNIKALPPAQPTIEPRTKGEWIIEGTELHKRLRCSCCLSLAIWAPYAMSFITPNFCPNCGADMREEKQ